MKSTKRSLIAASTVALALALTGPASLMAGQARADELSSVAVDLTNQPMEARSVGMALRLASEGTGPVMLRAFAAGEQTPPHRPRRDGVRIAVVVSGTLSHGVGEEVDPAGETAYVPGDVLLLPSTEMYWFAARGGDASILFVFVDPDQMNPSLLEQMQ